MPVAIAVERSSAEKYTVKAGDTLATIAAGKGVDAQALAAFNCGTIEPVEVNRWLLECIGAGELKDDPGDTVLQPPADSARELLIPKKWRSGRLDVTKTHTVKVKRLLPPTAIRIEALDKWFIPGKESCSIKYSLEGLNVCAKKVALEVYGSNYSDAGAWNKSLATFPDSADKKDTPLYTKAEQADAPERGRNLAVTEWKGTLTATAGALGKKTAGQDRVINVAFSPYTVLLRYYLDDGDKDARILLEPFWPQFDSTGAAKADSMKIQWNVKGTGRFGGGTGSGMLEIWDASDQVVFRKALADGEMTQKGGGFHEFTWDGNYSAGTKDNSKGGKKVIPEDMPYRVQLQMHTRWDQPKGLAAAAMHTEVRLFVHPQTHAPDLDPYVAETDQISLALEASEKLLTTKTLARGAGTAWCKYQLALAGFHPGPVDGDAAKVPYKSALTEFKRSVPKKRSKPADDYQRFALNLSEGDDVKDALEEVNKTAALKRPWFANATSRADLDLAAASATLRNPAEKMIVWADDRHSYTDPAWLQGVGTRGPVVRNKVKGSAAAMANYGGPYDDGDDSASKKTGGNPPWIPRPWIPLAADFVLLGRGDALNTVIDAAGVGEDDRKLMRKAIGPLRVDWSFDEIDADPPQDEWVDTGAYDKTVTRTKTFIEQTLIGKKGGPHARKDIHKSATYFNCPAVCGGIRPAALSDYYKEGFGHGDDNSLKPWRGTPDATYETIATVVHDNLGQTGDDLVPDRIGRAGVYFRPSTIGGDGYRVRAQVRFEKVDAYKLPNLETLKKRYPLVPQAQSCKLRIWRKASIRAYVQWSPTNSWAAIKPDMMAFYRPACLHLVPENGAADLEFKAADLFPKVSGFRDLVREGLEPRVKSGDPLDQRRQDANITLNPETMWPWAAAPQIGVFEAGDPDATRDQARTKFGEKVFDPIFYNLSNLFALSWVESLEKKKGRLRGHVVVEFKPSDPYYVQKYQCGGCNKTFYFVEHSKTSNCKIGKPCPSPGPPPRCAGKLRRMPVQFVGYYKCAGAPAHEFTWDEDFNAGGKFATGAYNCPTCHAALSAIQSKLEQYKCPRGHWQGSLAEAGAGGDHLGEQCPMPDCTERLFYVGAWTQKYQCSKCGALSDLAEDAPDLWKHKGEAHTGCARGGKWQQTMNVQAPPPHLLVNGNKVAIKDRAEDPGYLINNVPVPSLGVPLGVALNFAPNAYLWAHEVGHTRFLEHTEGPGTSHAAHHDHRPNTGFNWVAIKENDAHSRCWDRTCLMSYIDQQSSFDAARDKAYMCGKCVLKTRGWQIGALADPAAGVKDP